MNETLYTNYTLPFLNVRSLLMGYTVIIIPITLVVLIIGVGLLLSMRDKKTKHIEREEPKYFTELPIQESLPYTSQPQLPQEQDKPCDTDYDNTFPEGSDTFPFQLGADGQGDKPKGYLCYDLESFKSAVGIEPPFDKLMPPRYPEKQRTAEQDTADDIRGYYRHFYPHRGEPHQIC